MARKSRMSVLKRQRELQKAEKAARKRARRHGVPLAPEVEPRPTFNPEDAEETTSQTPASDEDDRAPDPDAGSSGEG